MFSKICVENGNIKPFSGERQTYNESFRAMR